MKTFVKLLVTAVFLNAAFRSGTAAWTHYQLEDAAQQIITYGPRASLDELHGSIMQKAAELRLPLQDAGLVVQRDGFRTTAQASYLLPVEIFPRYTYNASVSFDVESFWIPGGK